MSMPRCSSAAPWGRSRVAWPGPRPAPRPTHSPGHGPGLGDAPARGPGRLTRGPPGTVRRVRVRVRGPAGRPDHGSSAALAGRVLRGMLLARLIPVAAIPLTAGAVVGGVGGANLLHQSDVSTSRPASARPESTVGDLVLIHRALRDYRLEHGPVPALRGSRLRRAPLAELASRHPSLPRPVRRAGPAGGLQGPPPNDSGPMSPGTARITGPSWPRCPPPSVRRTPPPRG